MSIQHNSRWRTVAKRAGTGIATAGLLAATVLAGTTVPATAATENGTSFPGQVTPGWSLDVSIGDGSTWLGAINGVAGTDGSLAWCIQATAPSPTNWNDDVSLETFDWSAPFDRGQDDNLKVTTAQLAWIINEYEGVATADSRAAISYLTHVNFDQGTPSNVNGEAVTGTESAQAIIAGVQQQIPQVDTLARQYAAAGRANAATGYAKATVQTTTHRTGTVENIGIQTASGWQSGKSVTVTLDGPATFDATGTNTWTGTTGNEALTIPWTSTGNGTVTITVEYSGLTRTTLTKYNAQGVQQDTISYGNRPGAGDPETQTVAGVSFEVIHDFQPEATSNVGASKVVDKGVLSDTITTSADPDYGDGQWLKIDDTYVPVTFEGTAYYTGQTPAAESASVPEGATVVGSTTITATGPGEYTATIKGDYDPAFVTWVWKVVKADQTGTISGIAISDLVHADWSDSYGLADETSSIRHEAEVDSTMTTRETKTGTYLVDDLWVTGLPSDHPSFAGGSGFKADVKEFTQTLLFFPEGLEVSEANASKAETIAAVTVPATNGFYPSVGSTEFKMKDGEAGTYVFVTTFAGDDRVKAFTSSVEDTTEQYTVVPAQPTLKTTATDASDGDKILPNTGTVTINDEVCYTNLTVGKEYTLTGTLMDKSTGKAIQADGTDLTATTTFTPTKKDDCTTVTFTTEAKNLAGKTTVVFERLTQDGRTIAVHTDINDEGQTVTTPDTPTLATTATDAADGDKTVTPAKQVTINDKVCYTNLTVGKEYTLNGTLMDKATEKPYQVDGKDVTGETTFTPTKKDDCTTVTFTFDGSALSGKSLVVFEEASHDGTVVAVHTDINDEGQTVTFTGGDNDKGGAGKSKGLALTGSDAATIGGAAALMAAAGAATVAIKRRRA